MVNGYEGVPVAIAAQRLGIGREQVRVLVKEGVLVKIPIDKRVGPHKRYHIDEDSLKNYQRKRRWLGR